MNTDVKELHDAARQVMTGVGLAADEHTIWPVIAELGWLMVSLPEEQGGLGMGLAGAAALHLELGRGLATVPFLPALLAIDAISQGQLAGRDDWLERLSTGAGYVAAPLAESSLVVASGTDGVLRLTGTAVAVPSADRASHVLICSTAGDCVALVSHEQKGVKIEARPTWDQTRRLFDVQFADVTLDQDLTLATGPEALALGRRLAVQRDFALAADAVGGAAALLELTVDYLQTRQQFGRPLALFQALKHRCADLKALTEGAQALLLDNLGRLEQDLDGAAALADAARLGMAARQLACAAYAAVAEESLQLHGGIGMTEEHVCHLFLKRAMLSEHLGRSQQQYDSELTAGLLGSV